MRKNIAGQTYTVFAFDPTTNLPVTGDAANITASISIDSGTLASTSDVNPTETSGGFYDFTLSQAESNGDKIQIFPSSATANVQVIAVPGVVYTEMVDFGNTKSSDGAIPEIGVTDSGTAQSATSTTLVLRAGASFDDNVLVGATVGVYDTAVGYWQYRIITANTGSTDTVTVDAWSVTPTGTLTYVVFGTPPSSTTAIPDVNLTKISGGSITGDGKTTPFSIV